MSGQGQCRSCSADIAWCLLQAKSGKWSRHPIDFEPVPDGNLAVYRDHTGQLRARTLGKDGAPETYERRARSHSATCPSAAEHRKATARGTKLRRRQAPASLRPEGDQVATVIPLSGRREVPR